MTKSISDVRPGVPTDAAESSGLPEEIPEEITVLPPGVAPWFTVIVPTRNEAGNVQPLLARLAASLDGAVAEVLFVDDSTDGTDEVIRSVARNSGCAVRLLHRAAGERQGGLSGAVVSGLRQARGTWSVVMDGDCGTHRSWWRGWSPLARPVASIWWSAAVRLVRAGRTGCRVGIGMRRPGCPPEPRRRCFRVGWLA